MCQRISESLILYSYIVWPLLCHKNLVKSVNKLIYNVYNSSYISNIILFFNEAHILKCYLLPSGKVQRERSQWMAVCETYSMWFRNAEGYLWNTEWALSSRIIGIWGFLGSGLLLLFGVLYLKYTNTIKGVVLPLEWRCVGLVAKLCLKRCRQEGLMSPCHCKMSTIYILISQMIDNRQAKAVFITKWLLRHHCIGAWVTLTCLLC